MSSLKKLEEDLARAHTRDLRRKAEGKHLAGTLVRKASVTTNAGILGAMDKLGVPKTVKGFPWKLAWWVVATTAEALTKGHVQNAAAGASDGTMSIYIHNAIANGSFVAGEEGGGEIPA